MDFAKYPIVKLLNSCPLCNSIDFVPVLNERNYFHEKLDNEVLVFNNTWISLQECQECHFGFTKEIPISPNFFSHRYNNEWYDPEHEIDSNRKSVILEDIFDRLAKLGYNSGNLLDVGSFAGKLLLKAKSCGFNPSGLELNPKMAKFTSEKLGFDVICSEFQKVELEENKYQVITIIDVLEHLVEPRQVLESLARGLDHSGVLVIKVPNYPMQKIKQKLANILGLSEVGIFASFAHINHFSIGSMKKLLNELNLELIYMGPSPSEQWQSKKIIFRLKNLVRNIYCFFSVKINSNLGLNICYYIRKR